jgi:hypothetical protein
MPDYDRPVDLLDREKEWDKLLELWRNPAPDLVFVLGRRRAGKSFLLGRLAQAVNGLYYQATRRTEAEQLHRLSALVGAHFQDPALEHGVPFPDWESLFGYLTRHAREQPLLIVLDEFTWLTDSAPALPSIVQSFWDHQWQDTHLTLVLSGSHITAMRRLEEADQPLYGRRTVRLDVGPFDFPRATAFFPAYTPRERLMAHGIFGGLPGHLALLDPARTLGDNVARQMLSPGGRLLDEAQHMLDAFLADASVHYSVIEAIAGGERTWKGITNRVGRVGGSLSRAVEWLIGMGLIERVVPITERNPKKSKRAMFRVADPYVDFWHRFISPMVSAGMIGLAPSEQLWAEQITPHLDNYMGGVFEAICRDFAGRAGRLPFQPLRIGTWWDGASRNEIDVVALGGRGEVLVGECKWGWFDGSDLARLRERTALLLPELDRAGDVRTAIFAGGDVSGEVREEVDRGRVLLFTAEDLSDWEIAEASGSRFR